MGNVKRVLLLIFSFISFQLFSQSPEKINYQSIVRDLAGNVIQNQPISLRMSILSDSINGTIVYQETFQPTTNNFGLVNIKIGEGTPVIATMSSVDWSNGPFFLESAVDVTGGTNYIVVSTSQFMSVPYALYASESPLDTTQVQNIVNQQTNNFLDSTSIQNMIDSSVLNIDSTLIASWGYIDSNSIMILINNNSLDSTTIQNMIDNSIVNIDSSTVASWGYLDSNTIQILINNSTIDSSSVSNWGYLDSTTIQNIITQQTNNYLDSTSVQNMIDNSVTNIDSSTVASWGYVDSSSIMILINNNSLDSAAVQNMINSSITNVDSSTVASWGYLDSSSIIALISNSNIDSSSVANWGYLDSVSIQNMINNSSVNVDSTVIANFGFVAGPHTIDTDTQIDSTGISNYGFVTSSQVLDSSTVQNMINNSSSNVDSSTVSNWGYVDSSTVINLINQSGYLDSLTIQSMIDSAIRTSYFGIQNSNGSLVFGDFIDLTNEVINDNGWFRTDTNQVDSDGFLIIEASGSTGDVRLVIDSLQAFNTYPQKRYIVDFAQNGYNSKTTITCPIKKDWFWWSYVNISASISKIYWIPIINDSNSSSQSTIDSTTISNMGFVDSMTVVNMINSGGGSGTGGKTFAFPEGFQGEAIMFDVKVGNVLNTYTVPAGKRLYILYWYNSNPVIDGMSRGLPSANPLIVNAGQVVSGNISGNIYFNGYLVDEDYFSSNSGSSGSGSNSSIDSTTVANWGFSTDTDTQIDSTGIAGYGYVAGPHTIDTDTQIDSTGIANYGFVTSSQVLDSSTVQNMINNSSSNVDSSTVSNWGFSTDIDTQIDSTGIANLGYVAGPHTIDTDTQIDSTTISNMGFVDSMTVVNMINSGSASGNGYKTFKYPEGFDGEAVLHDLSLSPYTVPTGKRLYIISENPPFISGDPYARSGDIPVILNDGQVVGVDPSGIFWGLLVDKKPNLTALRHNLSSSSYTVPIGKRLYIFNGNGVKIDGNAISYSSGRLELVNSGQVVSGSSSSNYFYGYITDEDYFKSNTGTSSGSGSGSTIDSTTVANWGFSTDIDTQIDSAGIAGYGYVAGPHTIDTDTQIDSAGIRAMGFIDSATVQIMIDSALAANSSNNSNGLIIPTISTVTISDLTSNSVRFSSSVTNVLDPQIVERGFVYSYSSMPDILNDRVRQSGNGIGSFDYHLVPDDPDILYPDLPSIGNFLKSDSSYYVRAYVITEQNLTFYSDELHFSPLSVGQNGPAGGIVFYDKGIYSNGWRYLEMIPNSLGQYKWGCNGTALGVTSRKIGSGDSNTNNILNACIQTNLAADACNNLIFGGQTDWFLPSAFEVALMKINFYNTTIIQSSSEQMDFTSLSYISRLPTNNNPSAAQSISTSTIDKDVDTDVIAIRKF